MRRREFTTMVGGAAAWPLAASGQPAERVRRVGVLIPLAMDDPEAKARIAAFQQGLEQLGWTNGRNVQIDTRWAGGDMDSIRKYAAELVALSPDGHPGRWRRSHDAVASGDPHRADRIHTNPRPGRSRLRGEFSAAGRQRHRIYTVRIRHRREMAGAA
jgi:hypothetical protein